MSYRFLEPEEVKVGLECEEYILDYSRYISFWPGGYQMWLLGKYKGSLDPPEFKKITMTEKNVEDYYFWKSKGFENYRIENDTPNTTRTE